MIVFLLNYIGLDFLYQEGADQFKVIKIDETKRVYDYYPAGEIFVRVSKVVESPKMKYTIMNGNNTQEQEVNISLMMGTILQLKEAINEKKDDSAENQSPSHDADIT